MSRSTTNQQTDLCAQQRLSSAQSGQSICCPHEETLGPLSYSLSIQRKLWSNWANAQFILLILSCYGSYEPQHNKTNKMNVRPAKIQISLGIRPVWSVFAVHSVGSWGPKASSSGQQRLIKLGWSESSLGTHATLLVLSWCGSYDMVVVTL